MKNWTNSIALALTAATLTLTAGCTEDRPASLTEAEPETPETFDTGTVYQIVPIGGKPGLPGEQAVFLQFVSEEAKRAMDENLAGDALFQLFPLSAERAAQVWDNKRLVGLMGVPGKGPWVLHVYNYTPPKRYCPLISGCPERREEVRR